MIRPHLERLPALAPAVASLPEGYHFRTYRPGDEASWAALMNTGQMGEWTAARTREQLTGCPFPQFDPHGFFVITYLPPAAAAAGGAAAAAAAPEPSPPGEIVGAACAWLDKPAERETGTLHMVCVLPAHRGRGLAYPVCLAVLHRFRERGYRRVFLNTHEWRLGAVKTYLKLGFQPLYRHPMHPQQWREVVQTLAWTAPLTPIDSEAGFPLTPGAGAVG
jgi:mycothiol synthase